MRRARPLARSTKVAAILPQSRNLSARLPSRQPVTTPMASGRTAVDLDVGDQPLAVGSTGLVDTEPSAAKHSHANAEYLAGAEVAVRNLRAAQKFF